MPIHSKPLRRKQGIEASGTLLMPGPGMTVRADDNRPQRACCANEVLQKHCGGVKKKSAQSEASALVPIPHLRGRNALWRTLRVRAFFIGQIDAVVLTFKRERSSARQDCRK
jgi:hypothetical protein